MSPARAQALRWAFQRYSAMVLALCVLVHLAGMVLAVRGGLHAADILARLKGHWGWGAFYALFALACAVHAPLGVAAMVAESRLARARWAAAIAPVLAALMAVLGLRAVWALVGA